MDKKKALILGITGQDGSYLAELLLEKDYEVHGIIRRSSSFNTGRLDHIREKINLRYGDITDATSIYAAISEIKPNEIYNLSAQSHVRVSFDMPVYTGNVDAIGTMVILEAIRMFCPKTKFYQASTSELYGGMDYNRGENGYDEKSPFHPRSPYGVAKLYGFWSVVNYRESYNIFACNGILFNHESPRRGGTFITKKVIEAFKHKEFPLRVGNLDAMRDWGYAPEYVEGMWRMLQQDTPTDFVLATGEVHSVRELIEITAKISGNSIIWKGSGIDEKGYSDTGILLVVIDEVYFRPAEVDYLLGNPEKASKELGWKANVKFHELINIMFSNDK